jgi:putative DNA primase/helicase
MVTPRLLLTSPVRSCGKTTLLDVSKHMVARPRKIDSITAAGVYHLVDWGCTLLVDEADNLQIAGTLKAILNGGHRKGGARIIVIKGSPREFSLFGPMAFGAIGVLPLPTMSRSIVIRMERRDATLA